MFGTRSLAGNRLTLVILSFVSLFTELALIRWLGANVLYLAYFSNVVLLGSFLGIGLGFLRARRSTRPLLIAAPAALAVCVIAVRLANVRIGIAGADLIYFGLRTSGPSRIVVLPAIFLVVTLVMCCLGDGVARAFATLDNLGAYRLDIVGSVLGSAGFAVLAFLHATPLVWALIVAALLAVVCWPRTPAGAAAFVLPLIAVTVLWGQESVRQATVWTPYYRVSSQPVSADPADGVVAIVNRIPTWYQVRPQGQATYQRVYERAVVPDGTSVLVIGAGSGNDVAAALQHGAARVDAVEIDAHLLHLGRTFHPDHPYGDPRVVVHIDDGRAFLERTERTFDKILFALPDSLTLVQGQSAVRLESYLFTRQAIEAARARLNPGGVFAMYNLYREQWLSDRFAGTLNAVFGHPPCVSQVGDSLLHVMVVGVDEQSVRCPASEVWKPPAALVEPATDDHPFPYLRQRMVPRFFLGMIAVLLVISVVLVRLVGGPLRPMVRFADLFLMGVAFMLLETKNVVQFALLFGTTWLVNALVFVGILLAVLLAIVVSARLTIRRPWIVYALLMLVLAVAWLVPQRWLLELSFWPRLFVGIALAFGPVFLANVVFAQRFRVEGDATAAFGANLVGAMIGGALEYASLIVGYRNLLIVAAALYLAAALTGRARTLAHR